MPGVLGPTRPKERKSGPYRFTARRVDEETGNYYYRNRYYHPDSGRFMSQDPIGYGDGVNMYTYAYNDPVNFRDPMGLNGQEEDNEPKVEGQPGNPPPPSSNSRPPGGITVVIRCDGGSPVSVLCPSPIDPPSAPGPDDGFSPSVYTYSAGGLVGSGGSSGGGSSGFSGGFGGSGGGGAVDRATSMVAQDLLFDNGPGLLSRGISIVGGFGQLGAGIAACSSIVGCVGGVLLIAHGLNNIWEGASGDRGLIRVGYQAVLGESVGNIAFSAVDITTSVGGVVRLAPKAGQFKLFRPLKLSQQRIAISTAPVPLIFNDVLAIGNNLNGIRQEAIK